MAVILTTRTDFSLDAFDRVAWQGEGVQIHRSAVERMAACRDSFMKLIDSDPDLVIYGVTTGYGQMASVRLSPEERKQQAQRPPTPAMASFGGRMPERVARGIVFARLSNFVEGHAAITPAIAEGVAGMLDGEPLPAVPLYGNGCPGEILPLSQLFTPLYDRFEFGEKDSLSLINGSPCASALIADATLAARRRLALAIEVFGLSIEALGAPLGHFDPVLDELWEDPHEAAVLRGLRYWMEGGGGSRRYYQAPVSWRILPRVLGQAQRALAQAEEVAAVSLRAVSDNPVYVPPDEAHPHGRCISTGGYHNGKAYPALDNLAAAWADLTLLCDRQVSKLLDGRISQLPDQLTTEDRGYLGCLGMAAVAYAEEARQAAQRSFLPGSEGGGFGQNDVAVPTFFSWRKEAEAARFLEGGLALLAAIASQAFFVTGRPVPPRLAPLVDDLRESFAPVATSRALGPDAEALRRIFTVKIFGDAAEEERAAA